MKALLVGASGLVGRECLRQLLNDDEITGVEIWSRRPVAYNHPKLTEWIVDFNHLAQNSDITADIVFCCLGTTMGKAKSKAAFRKVDYEYPLDLAVIAQQKQVKHFSIVSSIGANTKSKNFYLRTKGEMEEAIAGLALPSISILRPSILLGKRKKFRFGETIGKLLIKAFTFLLIGSLKKYRGNSAKNVAKTMIFKAKEQKQGIEIINSESID